MRKRAGTGPCYPSYGTGTSVRPWWAATLDTIGHVAFATTLGGALQLHRLKPRVESDYEAAWFQRLKL